MSESSSKEDFQGALIGILVHRAGGVVRIHHDELGVLREQHLEVGPDPDDEDVMVLRLVPMHGEH